ncbi:AMP-binding protein [Candidatus Marithrix sp. Canyon 246]|uniref:AMP-binding protein n=1 Tax=Candidatus Marithrix sp. Canyon 246 TaxID=1827136 RepID=UPI00084A18BF|nr:AMP-binding protein [Candidatus Marithrix sp. Canyon 246]
MSNPLLTLFQKAYENSPKHIYWLNDGQKLNYGDFLEITAKTQIWYESQGVKAGERIFLAVNDDRLLVQLCLGAWRAGAVVIVADPKVSQYEAEILIDIVKPNWICTERDSNFTKMSLPLLLVNSRPKKAKLLKKLLRKRVTEHEDNYPSILDSINGIADIRQSDTSGLVLFSSGTTSRPKAILLSLDAILSNIKAISQHMHYSSSDRIHNALPLHHADGLLHGPILTLFNGATLVRSKPFSFTNIDAFIGELYREQVTHFITVPVILSYFNRIKDQAAELFQWQTFKYVISTAGPLNNELWQLFEDEFNVRICNIYGLTETSMAISICGPDDRKGTVGKVLNGIEIKISSAGELIVSGNMLFKEYIDNPKATLEVLKDGWLHTGDLASIDDKGFISIVGRLKNVIIKGGENISPEEIRDVLLQHPEVCECEVIGLANPEMEEQVIACIVTSTEFNKLDLKNFYASKLSTYKHPDYIFEFDSLPRGPSGKVALQTLQKICEERKEKGDSPDISFKIIHLATDMFKVDTNTLSSDSSPETTLGWDSLGHLQLILAVEKHYKISFTAREMMSIERLNDVIRLVQEKMDE